jgi:two-component system, NarL family, response regulator NreC
VLDLNMPGGSSLEAIPVMGETSPNTVIVVLTMQEDPAFAREALQAGAKGYVLKQAAGGGAGSGDTSRHIQQKLGRSSSAELVRYAPDNDLIER